MQEVSRSKVFGGTITKFGHKSSTLGCDMKFNLFMPANVNQTSGKTPFLIFLSGLTCNEDNFITKAGAIQTASELGLALVCPDTSPRGIKIEGDDDSYDLGVGAGFYINATQEKWAPYQMYSYITQELLDVVVQNFPLDPNKCSIFGHSMGGHGALICALKNPEKFKSVSAFAPISNPTSCPWGIKAFTAYLGPDQESWKQYDAAELASSYTGRELDVLIDQGSKDKFLIENQLLPQNLIEKASKSLKITYREQNGYDHSYWFIQTFINDHLRFHARHLQ